MHLLQVSYIQFYRRYVDDIFSILRKRQVKAILKQLNSFHPNVQFTFEMEQNNSLPFLDVLVMKQEDNNFKFKIYRKPTHTDKYLDWIHPRAHKITVVNTLVQRALKICSNDFLSEELEHIENTLVLKNNFPRIWVKQQMQRIIGNFGNKPLTDSQNDKPRVILPYIKGLTEKLSRTIRRKLGNPLGYIPFNRMSDLIQTHKDKEICKKCGVWR